MEEKSSVTYDARGTKDYIAPEVWHHEFDTPADIWGLGCMILFLTIGWLKMSHWSFTVRDKFRAIPKSNWGNHILEPPPELPDEYKCFSRRLASTLELLPNVRPTASCLLNILEQDLRSEPFKFTINQYRLATSPHPSRGNDTPSLRFLRYCMEDDFSKKLGRKLHHHKGIDVLLDATAEINIPGDDGYTALSHAASEGHVEIVELLLEAKANVNAKDERGSTALCGAASKGHNTVVKLLLEAKADVNAQDGNGSTALHDVWELAIKRGLFLFISSQALILRLTNYLIA